MNEACSQWVFMLRSIVPRNSEAGGRGNWNWNWPSYIWNAASAFPRQLHAVDSIESILFFLSLRMMYVCWLHRVRSSLDESPRVCPTEGQKEPEMDRWNKVMSGVVMDTDEEEKREARGQTTRSIRANRSLKFEVCSWPKLLHFDRLRI